MNPKVIDAWGFQIFGYFCVAMLVYLFISWIFGFRIEIKHKKKNEDDDSDKSIIRN